MTSTSMLRLAVVVAFATVAGTAFADGPTAYAHDDATYGETPAAVLAGSDAWGAGSALAHDDTAYPDGPVQMGTEVRIASLTPPAHDDASYPADDRSAVSKPPAQLAARTPPRR
jgi:hypothetical protein